jgi:hypothetical protein
MADSNLSIPPDIFQSRAILEQTRRLMQERRKAGRQIIEELRAFKARRRLARQAA